MEIPAGKNAVEYRSEGGSLEAIRARVQAMEAQGLPQPGVPQAPVTTENPTSVVQQQEVAPLEPAKTREEVDRLQQFRDKEGQLDVNKIEKSNEHLEKAIEEKSKKKLNAEELIKKNKELLRKFSEVSVDAKKTVSEVDKTNLANMLGDLDLTPEQEKQIEEQLEKSPVKTLFAVSKMLAERTYESKSKKLETRIDEMTQQARDKQMMTELDSLIEEGHDWIATEGLARFEEVFKERPYLLQSKTPYLDASRFIEGAPILRNGATAQTQAVKTPIIGAMRAVPPPSATPPVSVDQQMQSLSDLAKRLIRDKQYKKAEEVERQMDALYRSGFSQ